MSDFPTTEVKCAKCGACTSVCPVYRVTGKESLSARGKMHLYMNQPKKLSPVYAEIFSQCLLCGACEEVCPRGLAVRDIITEIRASTPAGRSLPRLKQLAAGKVLGSPLLLKGLGQTKRRLSGLPEESGLLQKLAFFSPDLPTLPQPDPATLPTGEAMADLNYFSGCLASYLAPDIKKATINLAGQTGGRIYPNNENQTCCGLALYSAGNMEQARKTAILNIEAFEDNSNPILTSCSSCYSHMKNYPQILGDDPVWNKKAAFFSERLREFSSYLDGRIPEELGLAGGENIRVAIHDPCHLRFGKEKITEAPRRLLKETGNFMLREIPGQCCGHGGLFQLGYRELSRRIGGEKVKSLSEISFDYLLTTCSGCLLQLNRSMAESGLPVKTYHFAVFLNHYLSRPDSRALLDKHES